MLSTRHLRMILPQSLRRRIKHLFHSHFKRSIEWEYVPEGWKAQTYDPDIKGWNVQAICDTYMAKWPRFRELLAGSGPLGVAHETDLKTNDEIGAHNTVMSYAYALALASRGREQISLLDWGGGIGHYYELSKAIFPDLGIEYHCKDMPVLSQQGSTLFPDAHFYSDDSCLARSYDMVLASSSLQYSQDWRATFDRLANATRGVLYVTRIPVVKQARSFVFVQRPYHFGYNTEYLGWCFNHGELLQVANAAGLRLLREVVIDERPVIDNAPEQNQYRGFIFSRS